MRYLLDTNTCIAVMRNHPLVIARLQTTAPADCVISAVTGFELFTGVEKCTNPAKESAKVALLLSFLGEIPFDPQSARRAARIRAELESIGQAIGPYDTLLAGHAMANSLILVTANTNEFMRVAGLTIEN